MAERNALEGPPDYADRYNTELLPGEEQQYQQWLRAQSARAGRDMSRDNFNYDMRGAWLAGAAQSDNDHWPDTFKKPNHPSFSNQTQYHGVDGQAGGAWTQDQGGGWVYTPSTTNLLMYGRQGLQDYFRRGDPGVRLMTEPQ